MSTLGNYYDGSVNNVTGNATWSSDNTGVATVDGSGVMTGSGVGSANLTASATLPHFNSNFCEYNPTCNDNPDQTFHATSSVTVVSLLCTPTPVGFGSTITCTVSGASASQVSQWTFSAPGIGVNGPSQTLVWAGMMVVSGTVSVTVSGAVISQDVTVSSRSSIANVTMPSPALVPNGSIVGTMQLATLTSPPTTAEGSFGQSIYSGSYSINTSSPQSGPNAGIYFVSSLTDNSAFGWELNPALTNQADQFYQQQGFCHATVSAIVSAVQAHEVGMPGPSHYTEVQAALANNNPGVVATNTFGSTTFIQGQITAAYQAAADAGNMEPPSNLPSNINFPPYQACP